MIVAHSEHLGDPQVRDGLWRKPDKVAGSSQQELVNGKSGPARVLGWKDRGDTG